VANLSKTLHINFYQNRSRIVEVTTKKFWSVFMPRSVQMKSQHEYNNAATNARRTYRISKKPTRPVLLTLADNRVSTLLRLIQTHNVQSVTSVVKSVQ